MTTFYAEMKNRLMQNGLSDNDATEVMKGIVEDKNFALGTMDNRWGDNIDDYPPMAINILWMSVKDAGLEHIEKNMPEAWFKPMFFRQEQLNEFLIANGGEHLVKE